MGANPKLTITDVREDPVRETYKPDACGGTHPTAYLYRKLDSENAYSFQSNSIHHVFGDTVVQSVNVEVKITSTNEPAAKSSVFRNGPVKIGSEL